MKTSMTRAAYEQMKFLIGQMFYSLSQILAPPTVEECEAMQQAADRLVNSDKTKTMGLIVVEMQTTGDPVNPIILHVHATGEERVVSSMIDALQLDLAKFRSQVEGTFDTVGEHPTPPVQPFVDPRDGTPEQCECDSCKLRRTLVARGDAVALAPGVLAMQRKEGDDRSMEQIVDDATKKPN